MISMRLVRTSARVFAALLIGGSTAYGQLLYSQDFDIDDTANWTVNSSGEGVTEPGDTVPLDTEANFFFDYSTVGIPSAPNSVGGTTRGMTLQANLFSDAFGGFSVSPTGQSFPGDHTLSFDMWSNYPGDLLPGGSGSTNLSYAGILSSGTFENKPGAADGVWFAYTGDGDSSSDYRVYSSDRDVSYQLPVTPPEDEDFCACDEDATYFADSRDHIASLYFDNINPQDPNEPGGVGIVEAPAAQLALFPQQTGHVRAGAAGMAWRRHDVTKLGDTVSWKVDGIELISLDISNFATATGGENILFGHSDTNFSSSTDFDSESLLFTLVDNIEVNAVTASNDDADFNNSGLVDGIDLLIWQRNNGLSGALQSDGDANDDGEVNGEDLAVWETQYGGPPPAVAAVGAVPEPGSLLILAIGVVCLVGNRAAMKGY